ncbi:MAG: putative toxin-antitoxin system toxin component, PIN family [Gammaproteobacteria bacterium]|nr:putative toxin-antitoxin system toxin component, PIN family [Gammaproteobacteria bacterium]
MRLVVDTNVVVAAFRSASGASNALLRYAETGTVTLLCSTALFLEYEAVLSRPEVRNATGHTLRDVEEVMDAFALIATPVDVHFGTRPMLRDADDEMVVEVASNGGAEFIVTHNPRDFLPAQALGVRVVTPSEVVRRLRHE